MTDKTTPKVPYSYHTFFFPFLWNDRQQGKGFLSREAFLQCIDKKRWIEDFGYSEINSNDNKFIAQFNQYRYFNRAARNTIYTTDGKESVVYNYRYNLASFGKNSSDSKWLNSEKGSKNPARYIISKDGRKVSLAINGIKLKLFNTGIGVMIFELENYDYSAKDDFNWINDRGRRIYMPYMVNGGGCYDCADEITLSYDDKVISTSKLIKPYSKYYNVELAEPIIYLLSNGEYSVTADAHKVSNKTMYIEPIIDDRMFVAGYYINKQFASELTEHTENGYRFLADASQRRISDKNNSATEWYRAVFVDGGSCSCQSQNKLYDMISEHTYDRWAEYGSLTGISEYSMITVTGSGDDYLVCNFLTEYVEMMILVLAQRASLLSFERMISDSAMGKRDICEIQGYYVKFQSQLLLKEVTPQQQGIELYNMLLDNLFIQEQADRIDKQIEALSAQKSSKCENRENLILFLIAILSILDAVNCLADWITVGGFHWLRFSVSAIISVVAVILFYVFKRK